MPCAAQPTCSALSGHLATFAPNKASGPSAGRARGHGRRNVRADVQGHLQHHRAVGQGLASDFGEARGDAETERHELRAQGRSSRCRLHLPATFGCANAAPARPGRVRRELSSAGTRVGHTCRRRKPRHPTHPAEGCVPGASRGTPTRGRCERVRVFIIKILTVLLRSRWTDDLGVETDQKQN